MRGARVALGIALGFACICCEPKSSTDIFTDRDGSALDAKKQEGFDAGPVDASFRLDAFSTDPLDTGPVDGPSDTSISECAPSAYPPLELVDVVPGHRWVRPVFLTHAPGRRDLFVVDANGLIWIVRSGSVLPEPFLDIQSRIGGPLLGGDERGLLGLAFHPQFQENGRFFVAFTPRGGPNIVAEGRRSVSNPDRAEPELTEILSIPDFASNHNGGMIAFGPDGFLYIGTGDGGGAGDPRRTAQDPMSLLGKILRIDVDGSSDGRPYRIPPSNPFASRSDVLPEIWAFGLRNPWRFSFDRNTGAIYIGDVGQNAWEEIDYEPPLTGGRNYGWSAYEGR
ncbi:MAG: PQQ-dependent sugar dehydrogenase, partial [Deltaproteobacteria bacterium]|nr:PQQ-dependent sugar dehydrogenase [Deltaproteobacteria bacterium]